MAGIPPLAGFFSKYAVLIYSFERGLFYQVITGLSTSLVSTFYYLRVIKTSFFESVISAMEVTVKFTVRRRGQLVIMESIL